MPTYPESHQRRSAGTTRDLNEAAHAELVDPALDPRWAELIATSPDATVFHHPAWLRLLARQYGYEPFASCLTGEDDRLIAGLPLAWVKSRLTGTRVVGLPFSDLVEPLYADGFDSQLETLLLRALEAEQVRSGVDLSLHAELPDLVGGIFGGRFWHHTISLKEGYEEAESRFSSAARRGVRKAKREGVSVRQATDRAALDAFYRMHLRTRKTKGVLTQPKSFIRAFADLFEQDLGYVMLAEWRGEPVAGAVFLRWRGHLIYKYGASDRRQLDKRPNNLLFAEAIRDGCESGGRILDLGRTDLDAPGLRAFKLGWGAEEREIAYTLVPMAASSRSVRSIPQLQEKAIRHGPALLGQVLGAILYLHFG
jgi:CelD/BcsL family acetyltransferase involved in cellulose biosynthesis